MRAEITDELDLILSWDDAGRNTIKWSVCSNCEFEVNVSLHLDSQMNYQGRTCIEFSTTCYAWALRLFADSIEKFVAGTEPKAEYVGSEDMSITIGEKKGQGDFSSATATTCDLDYEPFRFIDDVWCSGQINVTLGILTEGEATVRSIRQVLNLLKVDTSLEVQPDPPSTEQGAAPNP